MKEIKITASTGEVFELNNVGYFEIRVSTLCRVLTFSAPNYIDIQKEVTGSYLQVVMEYDTTALQREEEARRKEEQARLAAEQQAREEAEAKLRAEEEARMKAEQARLAAEEKARKEAEAKAKAEEEARKKAEQARLAAEEKARKEAEAKAKAEEEARKKAEQARLAAEEQARKEAEAKAKAEEEARIKAEQARLAAEEKARKEAEAKAKAEEEARKKAEQARLAAEEKARKEAEAKAKAEARAQAKAERQAKDSTYSSRFFNKGLAHSVRVSYASQLSKCEIGYLYSGYRSYASLHPFSLDYTLSYKVNRVFSIGVGVGVMFNAKSITIVGDEILSAGFKERRLDVPVFATMGLHFGRWRVRPSISASIGYYPLSRVVLGEGTLGMEFRLGRRPSIEVGALVKTTPYPSFDLQLESCKYKAAISPGVAVRFNF